MKFHIILYLIFLPFCVMAQIYDDHLGAGQYVGVIVSSSNENTDNTALNSVNGTGMLPDLANAARFLSQATMGYNYEEIEHVSSIGIDAWLEEQFAMPADSYEDTYREIFQFAFDSIMVNANIKERREFSCYTFYEKVLKEPDVLRHKVAFALSQILVISDLNVVLGLEGFGNNNYHDILYQNAFGNYRDILHDITWHPSMGMYLSAFRNAKADFGLGVFPDENYAREIMQLFSIGLLELNNDGTLKLDADGNTIPTYDIEDIQEFSRVFTGMAQGERTDAIPPKFTSSQNTVMTVPMQMYEAYHDIDEKTMIDGSILPAGQSGVEDISDAIDLLFNHPNIAPFIGKLLIQHLVKSNPSPAYVNRVANAFINNGQGERGDLEAVVRAILTDPEARHCTTIDNENAGKLIQPIERFTNLFLAFDISTPSDKMWFFDWEEIGSLQQSFLSPPSVFSFFLPAYAEKEYVQPLDMVSPEFQILNSTSSIHYLNKMEDAVKNQPFANQTRSNTIQSVLIFNPGDAPVLDFSDEIATLNNDGLSALMDRLNILLCRGQLSDSTKAIIEDAITQSQANVPNYTDEDAVKDAVYFIMVSPDYMILR